MPVLVTLSAGAKAVARRVKLRTFFHERPAADAVIRGD